MIVLSKLADYGVIVATHLACHPERQITAGVLATETRLPQATVAKVLKSLAHAGIVTALRGAAGGYRLARPPAAVSVAEVVAAIDGAIGMTQCSNHDTLAAGCEREAFCPTRPHWQRINLAIGAALASVSLAEMADSGPAAPFRRHTPFMETIAS
ncbi:MAG TPA: SUF system Fe-S cluster assembly regulator [Stellaceae bacterium]|nr:SUF system Fe-S cluster assembly regulator [Stellaceae bacterium]